MRADGEDRTVRRRCRSCTHRAALPDMERVVSAHYDAELGVLEAAGRHRLPAWRETARDVHRERRIQVVLSAALPMERSELGMTWRGRPGMVQDASQATVTARFAGPWRRS